MNALITGAGGFLGKNLLAYLKMQNIAVRELKRSYFEAASIESHCENFEAIIHLAAKSHDLNNTTNEQEYYHVNYGLTKILYDTFLKSEAKIFIFISSVKASSDQIDDKLRESDSPNPKTHYGKSKLMAEEYIRSQVLPEGKSFYILRPSMIHGPGNKGNLNLLYKLFSKGIPYPLAAFENKRSFLSVENLCFVIRELLERDDVPSGIYNVADDEALSTNELIKLIAKASDRKPQLWKINPVLIRYLAKLGDLLKLPLTTERLNKLTENYIVDTSKIKNALGKEFPVRAKDGILKTIESFQNSKIT